MPAYDRQPRRIAVGGRRYATPPGQRDKDPVQELAEKIREAYFREYRDWVLRVRNTESSRGLTAEPRYDGGLHTDGRHYQPVWPKIAEALIAGGCLSADLYISSQFAGRQIPQPNQLLSKEAWKRFDEHVEAMEMSIRHRFTGDTGRYKFAILETQNLYPDLQGDEIVSFVLKNWNYDLSALFCVIMAEAHSLPDVVEMWRELAIDEYQRYPSAYDTYWGERIPAWVRETTQGKESTDG